MQSWRPAGGGQCVRTALAEFIQGFGRFKILDRDPPLESDPAESSPGAKGSSDWELSKSEVGALVGFSWSADQIEAVDPLVEV